MLPRYVKSSTSSIKLFSKFTGCDFITVDVHELGLLLIYSQAYSLRCFVQSVGVFLQVVPVSRKKIDIISKVYIF